MASQATPGATDHRRAVAERNVTAILDAAEALIERRVQPSVSAVASEAKVSRVTVYAHFATRRELLEAVVERAVGRTADVLREVEPQHGSPVAALDRLLGVGWRELERNRAIARVATEQLSPAAIARTHEAVHRTIRELAERGAAQGAFRTGLPADWLATSCLALMHACGDDVRAGAIQPDDALPTLTATMHALFGSQR
jgi:AcrR family transcriptional regulator